MTEDDKDIIALALIDQEHDVALSKALYRWAESQQVSNGHLIISCLRTASLCMARMLEETPTTGLELEDCDVINRYAQYFHYYVHAAQEHAAKAKKNNH